jgi:hypothetical protein
MHYTARLRDLQYPRRRQRLRKRENHPTTSLRSNDINRYRQVLFLQRDGRIIRCLANCFLLAFPSPYLDNGLQLLGKTKSGTSLNGLTRLSPNPVGGPGALKYLFL